MTRKKRKLPALAVTLEVNPAQAVGATGLSLSATLTDFSEALERLFSTETGMLCLVTKVEWIDRSARFDRIQKRIDEHEKSFEKEWAR